MIYCSLCSPGSSEPRTPFADAIRLELAELWRSLVSSWLLHGPLRPGWRGLLRVVLETLWIVLGSSTIFRAPFPVFPLRPAPFRRTESPSSALNW